MTRVLTLEPHPQQVETVHVFIVLSSEKPGQKAQVMRMVPMVVDERPEGPIWYGLRDNSWFMLDDGHELEALYQDSLKEKVQ